MQVYRVVEQTCKLHLATKTAEYLELWDWGLCGWPAGTRLTCCRFALDDCLRAHHNIMHLGSGWLTQDFQGLARDEMEQEEYAKRPKLA